jgi:hypothetical protein
MAMENSDNTGRSSVDCLGIIDGLRLAATAEGFIEKSFP